MTANRITARTAITASFIISLTPNLSLKPFMCWLRGPMLMSWIVEAVESFCLVAAVDCPTALCSFNPPAFFSGAGHFSDSVKINQVFINIKDCINNACLMLV